MHDVDPYEWGNARVTYPDWKGTFQIDERLTGTDSIYSLTGVDADEWLIVGLDWGAGERGPHELHVITVPRGTDIETEVQTRGHLPVTDLMIHDSDPFAVLQRMIHSADFRARVRGLENTKMEVHALGDVPDQDEDDDS